jgi:hypothetical protein
MLTPLVKLREPQRVVVGIINVELTRAPRLIDRAFMHHPWGIGIPRSPESPPAVFAKNSASTSLVVTTIA